MAKSLIDLRSTMSDAMYWELHQFVCETRDGEPATVERWHVGSDGYDRTGRYFGSLARGERMYRVESLYRERYVRTRATMRDLRAVLAQ